MISCPKCKSTTVSIHEQFLTSSSIFLEGGKVVGTLGPQGGNSLGKFDGLCDACGHKWKANHKTGQVALEAAEQFELI